MRGSFGPQIFPTVSEPVPCSRVRSRSVSSRRVLKFASRIRFALKLSPCQRTRLVNCRPLAFRAVPLRTFLRRSFCNASPMPEMSLPVIWSLCQVVTPPRRSSPCLRGGVTDVTTSVLEAIRGNDTARLKSFHSRCNDSGSPTMNGGSDACDGMTPLGHGPCADDETPRSWASPAGRLPSWLRPHERRSEIPSRVRMDHLGASLGEAGEDPQSVLAAGDRRGASTCVGYPSPPEGSRLAIRDDLEVSKRRRPIPQ